MVIDNIGAGMGIILFDSTKGVAAGLHVMRSHSPTREPDNPACFADTGIAWAVNQLKQNGSTGKLFAAIAGGASLLTMNRDGGSGMIKVVKEILAGLDCAVKFEEIGGSKVRAITLNIDERKIKIS